MVLLGSGGFTSDPGSLIVDLGQTGANKTAAK
jgi:hypothetical protein